MRALIKHKGAMFDFFPCRSEVGGVQSGGMLHGAVFADGHHLRGKTVPPLLRRVPIAEALEALQLLQGMLYRHTCLI